MRQFRCNWRQLVAVVLLMLSGAAWPMAVEYGGLQKDSSDDAVTASAFRKLVQSAQECIRSNVDELMIGAAEMMLTGPSISSVGDMLKDLAAECVHASDALKHLRSGRYKSAGDIKRSFFRRHGPERYGAKGSLSQRAWERRLDPKRPVSPKQNVAVVEYEVKGVRRYDVAISEGRGLPGHSERVLMDRLDKLPPDARVTRIYSERFPCSSDKGCMSAMSENKRLENATREFSFDQGNPDEVKAWMDRISRLSAPGPSLPPRIPGF